MELIIASIQAAEGKYDSYEELEQMSYTNLSFKKPQSPHYKERKGWIEQLGALNHGSLYDMRLRPRCILKKTHY